MTTKSKCCGAEAEDLGFVYRCPKCHLACSVEPQAEDNIACPFCGDAKFDKVGLKSHLEHGDCEVYNNLESIWRI